MNFKVILLKEDQIKSLQLLRPALDLQNGCAFFHRESIEFLKLKEGLWADLIWNGNLDRKVRLYVIDDLLKDDIEVENGSINTVYLHPILYFNITAKYEISAQPHNIRLECSKTTIPELPETLGEAYFSLIRSPLYPTNVNFVHLLIDYFNKKERYLELDDVISVKWIPSDGQTQSADIRFKVTGLVPCDFGVVLIGKTKLYQPGQCNFYAEPMHTISYQGFKFRSEKILKERQQQVMQLLRPCIQLRSISNCILISGQSGTGKRFLIERVTSQLGLHLKEVYADTLISESISASEIKIRSTIQSAVTCQPSVLYIHNFDLLVKAFKDVRLASTLRECLYLTKKPQNPYPVLFIASTTDLNCVLQSEYASIFAYSMPMNVLSIEEREELFKELSYSTKISLSNIPELAKNCDNFVFGDLISLFTRSIIHNELEKVTIEKALNACLSEMQHRFAASVDAPSVPNVKWADVGGLKDAKHAILDTIQLPLRLPELMEGGRCGLLFYGPPGTGKTLLAKAIASECGLNFLSVKGPEVINMYVGQSEENVRNLFQKAKKVAPCIIFFDELDSIAPARGRSGDSGGVMDRLVSTLLSEMDACNSEGQSKPVFIVAATNRPDLLDQALLRPGRFDKMVYVDIPKTAEARIAVLKALTRKFQSELDLPSIEKKCPKNMSGADFYALCAGAQTQAIYEKIRVLEQQEDKTDEPDKGLNITEQHFNEALKSLQTSISDADIQRFERIKIKIQGEGL